MKRFPISERFTSLQGEGLFTGVLMHFIRFAGCSVGKKAPLEELEKLRVHTKDPLPVYRERCTLYDGRTFLCDTDFRTKEALTTEQLLKDIPNGVKHICLTGGEPMNQPLSEFLDFVSQETDYTVHIETSGTVSMKGHTWPNYTEGDSDGPASWLWITVSPKLGVLPEMIGIANEIKLLVDKNFDISKVPQEIIAHDKVWVQPVNEEFDIYEPNVQRCISLIHEHPTWRMSSQAHKLWKVR